MSYAPINVKPERGGEGRQGMGWEFDIFEKSAVKFPAHRQIIAVKCNQMSPLRAAHALLSNIPRLDPTKAQLKYLQIKLYNLYL